MKKRILFLHILYLTVLFAYILLMTVFDIGCPSRFLFGIPCPGCGGTRAIVALMQFDIRSYLHYHPLALPLGVAIWLMLHIRLFKKRKAVATISLTVVIANMIFFIWRLMNGLIP